jgi:hypothetical protein
MEVDTPAVRYALGCRLHDSDSVVRGEALVGLARRHDPRSGEALRRALTDSTEAYLVSEAAHELEQFFTAPAFTDVDETPLAWSVAAACLWWLFRRRRQVKLGAKWTN